MVTELKLMDEAKKFSKCPEAAFSPFFYICLFDKADFIWFFKRMLYCDFINMILNKKIQLCKEESLFFSCPTPHYKNVLSSEAFGALERFTVTI